MTKLHDSQGSFPHTNESRGYPRRKLSDMAYVELTQDNGGILLNLSEGGLAMQSALTLSGVEFPELRFQLPNMRGWLSASGRVAWMNESKKEAGIQFLDLHEHARAQIRTWVAGEEETAAASNGNVTPPEEQRVMSGAYGSHGSAVNNLQPVAEREGGLVGARTRSFEVEPARVSSKPAQRDSTYRFHDYSMFAPDPHATDLWIEPSPKRKGWGTYVLFTILLAALFFLLGAMVGRDKLSQFVASKMGRFVASVESLKDNLTQAPPPVKPPSAEEALAKTPASGSSGETANEAGQEANAAGQDGAEAKSKPDEKNSGDQANAQPEKAQTEQKSLVATSELVKEAPSKETDTSAAGDSSPRLAPVARDAKAQPKSTASTAHRNRYAAEDAVSIDYGRSILVQAPAPGSPPFFVHLPTETVSASSLVAISARRSIQVPPRTDSGSYGSERVIIGKLVAHSDPFYPPEARSQRIEGSVELRALVGRSGQVLKVTPVSGPPVLVAAAATALHEWRYEPTFINGDPVETQMQVTMVFRAP